MIEAVGGKDDYKSDTRVFATPHMLDWNKVHFENKYSSKAAAQTYLTFTQILKVAGLAKLESGINHRPDPPRQFVPRQNGPLAYIESNEWFQSMTQWCVASNPKFISLHDMLCHGVIDFGLSLIIAAKEVQDTAICAALGGITGDGLACLFWILLRQLAPGRLPKLLDLQLHYGQQRQIL
jgi:hypothetical protein